jgi:hypothetical protein
VHYLKGARGCTVHHVRAPSKERAAARDWLAWAVPLRLSEATPQLGRKCTSACSEAEREDATGAGTPARRSTDQLGMASTVAYR